MSSNPQKAVVRETGGLSRPIFFNGQILGADDFKAEQDYCRGLSRLTARAALGYGIASGLEVTVVPGSNVQVAVSPGLAIDRLGDVVELRAEARLPLSGAGAGPRDLWIVLRSIEELTDHRPAPATPDGPQSIATHARSVAELSLETAPPDPVCGCSGKGLCRCGVELGGIRRRGSVWRVAESGPQTRQSNSSSRKDLRLFGWRWPWP
jgi:hypothetical protein